MKGAEFGSIKVNLEQNVLPQGMKMSRGGVSRVREALRAGVEPGVVESFVFSAGHDAEIGRKARGGVKVGPFGAGSKAFEALDLEANSARRRTLIRSVSFTLSDK
jgi:hypothetical protein